MKKTGRTVFILPACCISEYVLYMNVTWHCCHCCFWLLSLKNVKKSFSNYAIYFFTLILGISIFYIFNALETQTIMLSLSKSLHEIISMMNNIIAGLSVFVSIILGFLIIYANQLLIKRRKKEFAVYMILGMSKKQISKI